MKMHNLFWYALIGVVMSFSVRGETQVANPNAATVEDDSAKVRSNAGAKSVVHDRLDLDTSRITGARELPTVTAIVPWKNADPGVSSGPTFRTMVNESLRPIDRDVFTRETAYFSAIKADAAVGKSKTDQK